MARLVSTEAEIEGRVEERWTLVEDDPTPEYETDEPPGRGRPAGDPPDRRPPACRRRRRLHLGRAACRGCSRRAVLRSPHANARRGRRSTSTPPRRRPGRARGARARRQPDRRGGRCCTATPRVRRRGGRRGRRRHAAAAERALAALAPVYEPLGFVVDLDEALAQPELPRMSRPRPTAATSTPPWPPPPVMIEAEYRTPAQVHNPLETALRRRGVARRRADRCGLDPGHLRRAATSSPRRWPRPRRTCASSASTWAAASAPSQGAGPEGDRGGRALPPQPAGRCGSCSRAARRTMAAGHRTPARVQTYRDRRRHRRHAAGDRGVGRDRPGPTTAGRSRC